MQKLLAQLRAGEYARVTDNLLGLDPLVIVGAPAHVGAGRAKADFVALRQKRDATLAMPRLIVPSLQVNMRAGQMPEPEDNGLSYLKVPINGL